MSTARHHWFFLECKTSQLEARCMIVKNKWVMATSQLKYFLSVLVLCCHRQFQTEFRFKIVSIFLWFKSCYFILNDLWTMRWRCPTYSEIHSSFGRNWDSKQSKRPKVRKIRRIKWVLSTLFLFEISLMACATNFIYSFRLWQFLGSLFIEICLENSNNNEVQFDETTFILLSITKSNITLRGYKLQTPPKNVNTVIFCY